MQLEKCRLIMMYTNVARCAVGLALLLGTAGWVQAKNNQELSLRDLQPGQTVEIQTAERTFRFQMIDRSTGQAEARVSVDGVRFGEPGRVFLLGATRGRQSGGGGITFVIMHRVKVGMAMELGIPSMAENDRWISSPVKRIALIR